jgi:hypothetical protein
LAIVPFLALTALAACGAGSQPAAEPPCVVSQEKMASVLDRDEVLAAPQKNGLDCIYASDGQPLILVSVRTPEQFAAERARFEDKGIKVPELVPATGFDQEATIDPRYNSLNVEAGRRIVSIEIVGVEPTDAAEQVELEKEIARAALEALR